MLQLVKTGTWAAKQAGRIDLNIKPNDENKLINNYNKLIVIAGFTDW